MALKSILGVMWVTRMTMNKECEDEMIRVREQGKWNGLKQNLELCQCIVIPFLHRTDPTAKCMCVIKGTRAVAKRNMAGVGEYEQAIGHVWD